MKYQKQHIERLLNELVDRYHSLRNVFYLIDNDPFATTVEIDGTSVRLAVDDFKAILAEVRRLK